MQVSEKTRKPAKTPHSHNTLKTEHWQTEPYDIQDIFPNDVSWGLTTTHSSGFVTHEAESCTVKLMEIPIEAWQLSFFF